MSKARQAAEKQWARLTRGESGGAPGDAVREASFIAAFLQGAAFALPEVPDDAVIEAMARALDESDPEGGNATPDPGSESWEWWIPQACAAYAALRGAMQ